jgi:hypothetical protein
MIFSEHILPWNVVFIFTLVSAYMMKVINIFDLNTKGE